MRPWVNPTSPHARQFSGHGSIQPRRPPLCFRCGSPPQAQACRGRNHRRPVPGTCTAPRALSCAALLPRTHSAGPQAEGHSAALALSPLLSAQRRRHGRRCRGLPLGRVETKLKSYPGPDSRSEKTTECAKPLGPSSAASATKRSPRRLHRAYSISGSVRPGFQTR